MADSKSIAVLNLGSQRLSGAVFSRTGGELTLKKYEFVDMTGDPTVDVSRLPQLKVGVQELVDRLKIKGSAVWYAVSGHTVFSRFVKLPPVQGDRVAQMVEFEAKQNVPFPINEVVWDFEFAADGTGETEVVLVAMKADALNEINDQVVASGVSTSGVDLAPLALYNAFRYSYADVGEPCVVIDIGARSTNLLFVEEGKFFTRNILVGGASITSAIAKEFDIPFSAAEQQKVAHGFVSQGGAVADHPDAEIAALSKVIRNATSTLHTQIQRTITFYKHQQGGNLPKRVFVCGGGALLGNMIPFLEEKLKLPVELFNPLRGVKIDRGVKEDAAYADAPFLSELTGLALRSGSACPSEIELVPTAVSNARDAARRAPALIMTALCLWAALGTGIMYYKNTDRVIQSKLAAMQAEDARLKDLANKIRQQDAYQAQTHVITGQLIQIVAERSYWVRLLTEINQQFANDLIWITVVEPLKDDRSMTPSLVETGTGSSSSSSKASTPTPGKAPVYTLQLQGLYRKNADGEQVVYKFATALSKLPWFDAPDFEANMSKYVSADSGVDEDRYAYKFNLKLPLKGNIEFQPQN